MKLGQFKVGLNHAPFVIAEMSGNHNQSLDRAFKIIEAAAASGVHALKLQTYTSDTMTLKVNTGPFMVNDKRSLWKGKSLYDLYKIAYTPWEWHKALFDKCKKLGLLCFSTAFDETAVDLLEKLDTPFYKIASFENNWPALIKKIARTGKPIIMSTGMATLSELEEAVKTARSNGCKDLLLLKCTSSYPADPVDSNIRTIPHLRDLFDCEVGLSDHTLGIGVGLASVALGSVAIEKHFTLSRAEGGVDAVFSLEPAEMKLLVEESKRAWQSLGKVTYGITSDKEQLSLQFRRALWFSKDIKAGKPLTPDNLKVRRPGNNGLPPLFYDQLLGRRVASDIKIGTPVTWDLIMGKRVAHK